ncbi:hypothetical protein [Streptomyces yaizuensis]|uniref:Uncharacterized protein n=1 Tax=Streptomyces yaizuensis TaxID=2989713 RepID=A0ABQ5NWK9_9ACTN|nr:hypothetical protein [Streptomyces sp. YSPA8]GLF94741.1 hypothetical protein SYYSPA8_10610 [Streptomyces sp. YSPA8]
MDEFKVRVTYHGWCIQESDEALIPVPYPDESSDAFLTQFEHRVDLYSAGHTHYADVVIEHWDSEPAPDGRRHWDETATAEFVSVSGEAAIWSDGRDHDVNLLGPGAWKLRAHCAGRAEVARACKEGSVADGVEKYLIQFWPR